MWIQEEYLKLEAAGGHFWVNSPASSLLLRHPTWLWFGIWCKIKRSALKVNVWLMCEPHCTSLLILWLFGELFSGKCSFIGSKWEGHFMKWLFCGGWGSWDLQVFVFFSQILSWLGDDLNLHLWSSSSVLRFYQFKLLLTSGVFIHCTHEITSKEGARRELSG